MNLADYSTHLHLMSKPEYAALMAEKKELEKKLSNVKQKMWKLESKVSSRVIG